MKSILVLAILFCFVLPSRAQVDIQLKTDPFELGYTFPRLNIGIEVKGDDWAYWSSLHYGWEGLGLHDKRTYLSGPYSIWGIHGGVKRILTSLPFEQSLGLHLRFDRTGVPLTDDVFYQIEPAHAVLFDLAIYKRTRLGAFIDYGMEFFHGRFCIEVIHSFGVRRIRKWYDDIENPFVLAEITPPVKLVRTDYKKAESVWKGAYVYSMKMGWRL